jgi:hypothetical protein
MLRPGCQQVSLAGVQQVLIRLRVFDQTQWHLR